MLLVISAGTNERSDIWDEGATEGEENKQKQCLLQGYGRHVKTL